MKVNESLNYLINLMTFNLFSMEFLTLFIIWCTCLHLVVHLCSLRSVLVLILKCFDPYFMVQLSLLHSALVFTA